MSKIACAAAFFELRQKTQRERLHLRLHALAVERRHGPGIRRPGHLAVGVRRRPAPFDLLEDLADSSSHIAHAAGDGLNCNAIRGDL